MQSLLTPSKTVDVDFPDKPGFRVTLAFLSREELSKIRKNCVTTKFDRRTKQPVEELNDELFVANYVRSIVKGWKGLKLDYLQDLMLVDLSSYEDLEQELEYTEENALTLIKNSSEFDSFVSDVTADLSNFTKYSSKN